jgi:hypothetical protein
MIPQSAIAKAYAALEQLKTALEITDDLRFRMKYRLLKMPDIEQVHKHYRSFGQQIDKLVAKKGIIRMSYGDSPFVRDPINARVKTTKMIIDSIYKTYGSSAHIIHKFIIKLHFILLDNAKSYLEEVQQIFLDSYKGHEQSSFDHRCEQRVLYLCDTEIPDILKHLPFVILPSEFVRHLPASDTSIDTYTSLDNKFAENYFTMPRELSDIPGQGSNVIDGSKMKVIENENFGAFLKQCCEFLEFTEQEIAPNQVIKTRSKAKCFPDQLKTFIKNSKGHSTPDQLFRYFNSKGTMLDTQCVQVRKDYTHRKKILLETKWFFRENTNDRYLEFGQSEPDTFKDARDSEQNVYIKDNGNNDNKQDAYIAFTEFLKRTYMYLDMFIGKRITMLTKKQFDNILFVVNWNKDYKSDQFLRYIKNVLGVHAKGEDTIEYFKKKEIIAADKRKQEDSRAGNGNGKGNGKGK